MDGHERRRCGRPGRPGPTGRPAPRLGIGPAGIGPVYPQSRPQPAREGGAGPVQHIRSKTRYYGFPSVWGPSDPIQAATPATTRSAPQMADWTSRGSPKRYHGSGPPFRPVPLPVPVPLARPTSGPPVWEGESRTTADGSMRRLGCRRRRSIVPSPLRTVTTQGSVALKAASASLCGSPVPLGGDQKVAQRLPSMPIPYDFTSRSPVSSPKLRVE